MRLRLISWNVNGRRRSDEQLHPVFERRPDIIALQEVTAASLPRIRETLIAAGLLYISDSFALAPDLSELTGPRRYGELAASRWPLTPEAQGRFHIPWPERVLTSHVDAGGRRIAIHTTHIPPGASNGWIKIRTLTGLFEGLAVPSDVSRILCGDFNTPQAETLDGQVVTWAQRPIRSGGWRVARAFRGGSGEAWDAAERGVLTGLARFDLVDVYRATNGYARTAASWVARRGDSTIRRRFDHVFASQDLRPIACQYLHDLRERGLSDHSPIEADFSIAEET